MHIYLQFCYIVHICMFLAHVYSCKKATLCNLAEVLVDRDVNVSQLDCQMN